MTSLDIQSRAEALILPSDVMIRLVELAERAFVGMDAGAIKEHKKRASYSPCRCIYCIAIKAYVRAKIRVHRIDRQHDWDRRGPLGMPHERYLSESVTRLNLTVAVKDGAKALSYRLTESGRLEPI